MNQQRLPLPESLEEKAKRLEAFETPVWAVKALYEGCCSPFLTDNGKILDPCYGMGAITETLREIKPEAQFSIGDIEDWAQHPNLQIGDFLSDDSDSWLDCFKTDNQPIDKYDDICCVINPPFSLATQFVDRAFELGCSDVFCFQRTAWMEGQARKQWWNCSNLNTVYVLSKRASSWRFDIPQSERVENGNTAYCWYHFRHEHEHNAPFLSWL